MREGMLSTSISHPQYLVTCRCLGMSEDYFALSFFVPVILCRCYCFNYKVKLRGCNEMTKLIGSESCSHIEDIEVLYYYNHCSDRARGKHDWDQLQSMRRVLQAKRPKFWRSRHSVYTQTCRHFNLPGECGIDRHKHQPSPDDNHRHRFALQDLHVKW